MKLRKRNRWARAARALRTKDLKRVPTKVCLTCQGGSPASFPQHEAAAEPVDVLLIEFFQ